MQIEAGKSKERELIFHTKKIIVRITLKNFFFIKQYFFLKKVTHH